jgi:hypothetical protein
VNSITHFDQVASGMPDLEVTMIARFSSLPEGQFWPFVS